MTTFHNERFLDLSNGFMLTFAHTSDCETLTEIRTYQPGEREPGDLVATGAWSSLTAFDDLISEDDLDEITAWTTAGAAPDASPLGTGWEMWPVWLEPQDDVGSVGDAPDVSDVDKARAVLITSTIESCRTADPDAGRVAEAYFGSAMPDGPGGYPSMSTVAAATGLPVQEVLRHMKAVKAISTEVLFDHFGVPERNRRPRA